MRYSPSPPPLPICWVLRAGGGRRGFELTISTIYTNENSWNLCFLTLLVIITMLCHYIIFLILFIFKKCSIMLIFHHEIVLTQLVTLLRGIVDQFWINSIKETFFYDRSISIKYFDLKSRKMVLKVSLFYVHNIYNSTLSDWLWAPYFLIYFESELF